MDLSNRVICLLDAFKALFKDNKLFLIFLEYLCNHLVHEFVLQAF